jgi:hypothetical protein
MQALAAEFSRSRKAWTTSALFCVTMKDSCVCANPGAAAAAALVKSIRSFGHQAFESELSRYFKKLLSVTTQVFGKPDIVLGGSAAKTCL